MRQSAKPKNETLRQASMERMQLLGVPEEESFERVVRLATGLLSASKAAFAMLEGNQLLLRARLGFDRDAEANGLIGLCGRPVLEDGPLLASDARADDRFAMNALVIGSKGLRFIAAVPIRSPELETVGLLAVADVRARRNVGDEIATLTDVAAIIERELLLRSLLRTDPLTGLYNRLHFTVEIEREWRRARRNKSPVSALLLNLDLMGDYNEIFGIDNGNAALRRVAERLAERFLRSADFLVRLGGDEFLIVLPDTSEQAAAVLAGEICELITGLDIHHPYSPKHKITASIGGAAVESDEDFNLGSKLLLERARSALVRAKKAGGNGFEMALSTAIA